jgi:RecJ-like exonuclease
MADITVNCPMCRGAGTLERPGLGGSYDCPHCSGTGKTIVGSLSEIEDIMDKLDDIMDKCNDIFEQVSE